MSLTWRWSITRRRRIFRPHRARCVRRMSRSPLSKQLDKLYASFNVTESAADPVWRVRRYSRPDDREVVAFIAAALAFGRVQSVLNSIDGMLAVMGESPAQFVRNFDPARDRHV